MDSSVGREKVQALSSILDAISEALETDNELVSASLLAEALLTRMNYLQVQVTALGHQVEYDPFNAKTVEKFVEMSHELVHVEKELRKFQGVLAATISIYSAVYGVSEDKPGDSETGDFARVLEKVLGLAPGQLTEVGLNDEIAPGETLGDGTAELDDFGGGDDELDGDIELDE